jgi:hypothetical protein
VLRGYEREYAESRVFVASVADSRTSKYCTSKARSAAATVGPIPTIPFSTLGPISAIQRSPRMDN